MLRWLAMARWGIVVGLATLLVALSGPAAVSEGATPGPTARRQVAAAEAATQLAIPQVAISQVAVAPVENEQGAVERNEGIRDAERQRDVELASFKPAWKVGQSWVVQTVTRQSQARRGTESVRDSRPVRWRFRVLRTEPFAGSPCFVVRITCVEAGRQPVTTLWVNRDSMTLRAVRTQLPAADGWRTLEETYSSSSEQPFPAFGPHCFPPLELPVFLAGTKGQSSFRYEATDGLGAKAVGKLGFAFDVEQSAQVADDQQLPSLLPQRYAKSPQRTPTLQVKLKSATNQVRQFWQAGLPWPVYSDNGVVQSSLLTVEPPAEQAMPESEP